MTVSREKTIQDYVLSFQRGEEAGFAYFFNSLYSSLLYYATRILENQADAEDIVEDSFIKVWEKHTTFSNPKVIKAYLYTTVKNTCINFLRREQRMQQREQDLSRHGENDYENFVLHEMIRAEVIREIHANIESLPGACRRVFKMLYIQGKSVREIAEELQVSVSTIKSQRAKGLILLRKQIPTLSVLVILELLRS